MLVRNNASADCRTVTREIVVQRKPGAGPRAGKGVWPAKNDWNRETENLYSAWIETLFDAPLDEAPSWKAMHEVLRDPSRNILFNHLGLREDQKGLVIFSRTAPTCLTSCAPISPSRWGCRSATRSARAATAARRRDAHNGGTS